MNRRTLLKTGGLAGVGMLTLGTSACGKNLSTYVSIIIGALDELKPLLPGQSALLDRAISIAKEFDAAYQAGKFANAITIFENLSSVISQLFDAAGGTSDSVKSALAIAGVALRTIAVLLKQQAEDPVVAGAVSRSVASGQKVLVQRLADPKAIETVFKTARP